MNKIGYTLYKLISESTICNNNEINDIININGLDYLLLNNGCLSNLLLYYIKNKNNININYISLKKNLMKRDYLNISKYYYDKDYIKSYIIFKNINYKNINTKDINFIINNGLVKLLFELEGLFITTTINYNNNKLPYVKLKINNNENNYINKIEENIDLKILNNLRKENLKFDFIIDAGNILHSYQGTINKESINGLIKILNKCTNVLIVIHMKHFKNKLIKNIIKNYNYYLTPYNYNDDLFILWFFLNTHACIISNDKFKDHNYNFNFKYNYNILLQYIISYSSNYELNYKEHNFIRKHNNNIYIPNINGNFLSLIE